MIPQRVKKAITDNPKKLATLIDLVNLPYPLKEFLGQSQGSQLGCFRRVWSYIKENNLQVQREHHLPAGDFPYVENFRERPGGYNLDNFQKLKPKMIQTVDDILGYDIPDLLKNFRNP